MEDIQQKIEGNGGSNELISSPPTMVSLPKCTYLGASDKLCVIGTPLLSIRAPIRDRFFMKDMLWPRSDYCDEEMSEDDHKSIGFEDDLSLEKLKKKRVFLAIELGTKSIRKLYEALRKVAVDPPELSSQSLYHLSNLLLQLTPFIEEEEKQQESRKNDKESQIQREEEKSGERWNLKWGSRCVIVPQKGIMTLAQELKTHRKAEECWAILARIIEQFRGTTFPTVMSDLSQQSFQRGSMNSEFMRLLTFYYWKWPHPTFTFATPRSLAEGTPIFFIYLFILFYFFVPFLCFYPFLFIFHEIVFVYLRLFF